MGRKSIWGAIFLNSALALALSIYTVVAIVAGFGKKEGTTKNVALALRVNDEFVVDGKTSFEGLDKGELRTENGKYYATLEGDHKFTCTVTKNNDKTIYDVTIYDYGTGTAEDPYNITKASDLFDLDGNGADIHDNVDKAYALRADIDLADVAWTPVGTRIASTYAGQIAYENGEYSDIENDDTQFSGTFVGNGYAIKNLTMNVTRENFKNYVLVQYHATTTTTVVANFVYLDLGFFGYTNGATINDLVFENASVSISADILDGTFTCGDCFDAAFVEAFNPTPIAIRCENMAAEDKAAATGSTTNLGVVAGVVVESNIGEEGKAVKVVNSNITGGNGKDRSGVGAIAGYTRYSTFDNIVVEDTKVASNTLYTTLGGVVGTVAHLTSSGKFRDADATTLIKNVVINNVTVEGDSYQNSSTGAVVGSMFGGNLENIKATGVEVTLSKTQIDLNIPASSASTAIAGAVGRAYNVITANGTDYSCELTNVVVEGNVNAVDVLNASHDAAGLVSVFAGTMTNCAFKGTVYGTRAAGLVVYNEGIITYTNAFVEAQAVDATISGKLALGGMVCYNYDGQIVGADELTLINVVLNGTKYTYISQIRAVSGIDDNDTEALNSFNIGGVAAIQLGGLIKNFNVNVKATNPINVGGVVGRVGGVKTVTLINYYYDANYNYSSNKESELMGGEIDHVVVSANIETVASVDQGSTHRAAGAAAFVGTGAELTSVQVTANINNYTGAADKQTTGTLVAGLIAEARGYNISVDTANITAAIRVNNSAYKNDGKYYSWVAGAVALAVQEEGTAIEFSNVHVSATPGYNTIVNMLGTVDNGDAAATEAEEFNATLTGAFGLFGSVVGLDATHIVISNATINGYSVTGHFNAAKAFGILNKVTVNGYSITNTEVSSDINGHAYERSMSETDSTVNN